CTAKSDEWFAALDLRCEVRGPSLAGRGADMAGNFDEMNTPERVKAQCEAFRKTFQSLRDEIGKVIVGHREVIDATLIALFAGGNVLLEGVPGLGKTLLVRTLAECLHLPFSRIQFTPDLMPADVI